MQQFPRNPISDKQFDASVIKVASILSGIPTSQAQAILEQAKTVVAAVSTVGKIKTHSEAQ